MAATKSAPRIVARSVPGRRRSEGIQFESTDGDWSVEISQDETEGWGVSVRLGKEWLCWDMDMGFLRGRDDGAYSATAEEAVS